MTHCPHCGVVIEAKPRGKPRSVPQHRRYFALIRAAHAHWPESHRFKPATEEHLRKWLQAKAGHAVVRTVETEGMAPVQIVAAIAAEIAGADPIHFTSATGSRFHVIASKSIDFDQLSHLAACALFEDVADVIAAETGLAPQQIMPPLSERKRGKPETFAQVPL